MELLRKKKLKRNHNSRNPHPEQAPTAATWESSRNKKYYQVLTTRYVFTEKRCHWHACEKHKGQCGACRTQATQELSRSRRGDFLKMKTVIATVFETGGLTVSEKKTEMMLVRTGDQAYPASPLVKIRAAGRRYRQATQFLYLGGIIHQDADLSVEIERRITHPSHVGTPQTVRPGAVR